MWEILQPLLSPSQYVPHGHCYLWQTPLVWLHVVSDFLIAIAYFSIPAMLIYFLYKRSDVAFSGIFALFGAFIILCGAGHLLDIWTLWHPAYWLSGVEKAMTALVSCYTAFKMVELLPQFLSLRTPDELEAINLELEKLLVEQKASATQQLIQSEKMASLGQMVAGVAHEINNPVNFIYGNLEHASEYIQDLFALIHTYEAAIPNPPVKVQTKAEEIDRDFLEQDLPKLIQSMQVGAERTRQIVLGLRKFSRLDEAEAHPIDLHDCLNSTLLILNSDLKKGVTVVRHYGELPMVEGFAGPLYQVFMNILKNAIDAFESSSTQGEQIEPPPKEKSITITTNRLGSDQVIVCIADNAAGIPPEQQSKIFEPFFTTKPIGVGTGLGLSISHQIIVEKHGGKLMCSSDGKTGTEFSIILPLKSCQQEKAA